MHPKQTFFTSIVFLLLSLTLLGVRSISAFKKPDFMGSQWFYLLICLFLFISSLFYLYALTLLVRRNPVTALAEFGFWLSIGILLGNLSQAFQGGFPRICYYFLLAAALATATRIIEK